jgi:hypothetical protein
MNPMELDGSFICPYCLQNNTILVDVTEGKHQELIEDCQVCCRPVNLTIEVDIELQEANVTADIP